MNNFNNNLHIMVDLETLGVSTDSIITQLSAVRFNAYTGETLDKFDIHIDIQNSLDCGFQVTASTILWWMQQSDEARVGLVSPKSEPVSVATALTEFSTWMITQFREDLGKVRMWGNGATFDLNILKTYYEKLKLEYPWKFYNERDVRTIVDIKPEVKALFKGEFIGVQHDGIADCNHQIKYLSKIVRSITLIDAD